ncbi:MAG: M20 family metallopeptidase [Treponema sp.]|nr:M20 family metallopeptidase [Treponema sp.]
MDARLEKIFSADELLKLAKDLIQIDSSTACEARERNVAVYLLDLFNREGIECYLQEIENGRGNVIAVIKGTRGEKGLMLNGHMDTVPASGMLEPFSALEKDGKLWGRGASDMKSGLAAMAYTLVTLKRANIPLKGDLVFAGVIDEEAARSTGSKHIAAYGPFTGYAIVGEATGLVPATAHKGIDYFTITFTGKAAHSSRPENGANAIYAAADYVVLYRDSLAPLYSEKTHALLGPPAVNMTLIRGGAEANKDFLYDKVETYAGVVPDYCQLWVDIRWIPGMTISGIQKDLEELGENIRSRNPGVSVKVEYIDLPRPAMEIDSNNPLVASLLKYSGEELGHNAECQTFPGFADSGILYGLGGILSLVLGPGDLRQAHSVDEHIEISQISGAARIYIQAALELLEDKLPP